MVAAVVEVTRDAVIAATAVNTPFGWSGPGPVRGLRPFEPVLGVGEQSS